jgi:hypothetical protein
MSTCNANALKQVKCQLHLPNTYATQSLDEEMLWQDGCTVFDEEGV